MIILHRTLPLPFALSLLLAACSGGGGGGGVSVPLNGPVTPFTSFGAITNNSLVEFRSPEIDNGRGGIELLAVNFNSPYDPIPAQLSGFGTATTNPVSALLYINGAGEAAQARLTVTFPVDDDLVTDFTAAPALGGDTDDFLVFENVVGGGVIADRLLFHAPDDDARALEYMSFGLWQLGLDGLEANFGTAQWGARTPDGTMPIANTAIYEGHLLGTWISYAGAMTHYEADSVLAADFGAGSVTLNSSNTRNLETGLATPAYNITGLGAATISDTSFTDGSFRLAGDVMNLGSFNGAFYGPNAAEAGATFAVDFNNGRYIGSVGGKQLIP